MKRTVNKVEEGKIELIVEVDKEVWTKEQEKAFDSLAKDVTIKGFRKGNAPKEMVRHLVGQDKIFNKSIGELIQPTFSEAIKEENIEPFAQPRADISKVSKDELEFKFTIILRPVITLGEYTGFNLDKISVNVNEEEIKDAIEKIVKQNADLIVKDGEAKNGDTVVIDYVGSVDGKEFDGGKAENYSLELGSKTFIPGFEDQLVGHKAGDKVDVNVTFPNEYVPELANKKAIFKVTVHEVKEKVIPELNEDLIKDLNLKNVKTEADLRAYVRNDILSRKSNDADSKQYEEIITRIVNNSKINLAPEIVEEEAEGMKKRMEEDLSRQGLSIKQYLEFSKKSNEDFEKDLKATAEKNLRGYLVIEKVAEIEHIVVEDEEVDFEIARLAAQYKMKEEEVKKIVGQNLAGFKSQTKQRRVHDFLVNNNVKK